MNYFMPLLSRQSRFALLRRPRSPLVIRTKRLKDWPRHPVPVDANRKVHPVNQATITALHEVVLHHGLHPFPWPDLLTLLRRFLHFVGPVPSDGRIAAGFSGAGSGGLHAQGYIVTPITPQNTPHF